MQKSQRESLDILVSSLTFPHSREGDEIGQLKDFFFLITFFRWCRKTRRTVVSVAHPSDTNYERAGSHRPVQQQALVLLFLLSSISPRQSVGIWETKHTDKNNPKQRER